MPATPPGTTKLPLQTPGQLLAAALNALGQSFKATPQQGNPNAMPGPATPQLPGTGPQGGLTGEQVAETQALMRSGQETLTDSQRINLAPSGTSRPPSAILGQRDFGPLQPLTPRYREGTAEADLGPRKFQYPVGVNILVTPRGEYPDLVPFYQLHNLALAYDVSAMCILTRVEEIQGMGHSVVATDKRRQAELQDVCDEVEAFFRKPDGVMTLDAWLASLVREHLTTDALTVYPRRNRAGDLYAAELVSGDTIKPLLDDQGRVQAYQQILYGYPFTEYIRTKNDESAHPTGLDNPSDFPTFSTRELMYLPRYTSTRHPYGNPPAETIVMRVNQALRKQVFDLAYFTAGNIPDMLATMPQGIFTPDEIKQFEEAFNGLLEGDDEARRKIRFIPYQADVKELRPFTYETVLDEWMLRVTCAAYAVPPQELGFTEDINRATAELQEAVNERRGLKPTSSWIKNAVLDELIHNGFGATIGAGGQTVSYPGMPTRSPINPYKLVGWSWLYGDKADANVVAQTDQIYLEKGVVSEDEVRAMRFGTELEGPSPATLKAQAAQMAVAPGSGGKPIPIEPMPGTENTPPVGQGAQTHDAEAMAIPIEPVKAAAAGWQIAKSAVLPEWERQAVETFLFDQMQGLLDFHQRRMRKGHVPQSVYTEMIGDLAGVLSRDIAANLRATASASAPRLFWREAGLAPSLQAAQAIMLTKQADAIQFCLQPYFDLLHSSGASQVGLADAGTRALVDLAGVWCTLLENAPIMAAFSRVHKATGGEGHIVAQPPKHIHCFPGDVMVDAPSGVGGAYKRWYEGRLIKITTARGYQLTGTPNHPILTDQGWIALGLLQKGDKVISNRQREGVGLGDAHLNDAPAAIAQVFHAVEQAGNLKHRQGTVGDFHGDGRKSDVQIVEVDGLLWDRRTAALQKHGDEGLFSSSRDIAVASGLDVQGVGDLLGVREVLTDPRGVSGAGLALALAGSEATHAQGVALGSASDVDAGLLKPTDDSGPADAEMLGDASGMFFGYDVAPDKIVLTESLYFAGHVYNLQTGDETYTANGIVTHNCRCKLRVRKVQLHEATHAPRSQAEQPDSGQADERQAPGHGEQQAQTQQSSSWAERGRQAAAANQQSHFAPLISHEHDEDEGDPDQEGVYFAVRDWLRKDWASEASDAALRNHAQAARDAEAYREAHSGEEPPDEADTRQATSDQAQAEQDQRPAPRPEPRPAEDEGVWVAVWHAADEKACTTLYKTPWGGLTRGCLGLNNICVSSGPLLGHMVPG